MAGNIGDLQVNLSANTSQMERDVSAALKRLESKGFNFGAGINSKAFTQPLGRITGASNEFQKSLDASNARVIAFGASAGAIYTVQKAFTSLISSTIDVQKSLTDINVILGASQRSLGQFGDSLFEIAKNSGQAFSTVATAAGELARQGLTLEQTLKRTSDALILARLSGLDAASSVEALTASINSFSTAALDSTQIVNKLAAVDSAFAVSSGDLAEALKRVGSSAQDVGVDFDELLAIVASVNQTTARGGAVIGNSLKTIFTRVQRTEVLDQLEGLGIAVRDLSGNTAPAIQVLTGLANKFDQLGSAQKGQVAELVGGVFQINILKAALGDLSKEYSVFGNALNISRGATDEAIRRNEDLNKTLSALLNKTVANLTRVGSDIGGLSFAPAIEKVLGGINTALESFDVKGDGIGSKIGKGIFEGIGSFISGPGLALLIGVFIKIFGNLARFTTDAVKTVLGLNKEAQAQAQIQERINSILAQNPQLIQNILNKQVSLLQVEKDILTVIQAQSQARQQSTAIAATLTRGLISKGVTADKGVISTKTKSQGFIPNFNANKEMMGAISGGYMPGQVRSMNIPNYGRVTYNDAETVKQFSGLSQPGIMPPANSDAGKAYKEKFKNKYGIDPYASSGFIPNFAASTNRLVNQGYKVVSSDVYTTLSKGDSPFKQYVKGSSAGGYFLDSNVEDKAIQYYKSQTESSVLSRGKGILSKEQVEKTGAVLVYPAFSGGGLGSTTATALKHRGKTTEQSPEFLFSTFGFPGPNGGIGPKLYDNVQKALKEQVYNFIGQATLNPKDLFDDKRFDNYVNTNINRSTIEAAVGGVFEAGLKSSIFSAVDNPNAPLDLSAGELKKLSATFKGAEPLAGFSLGEVKNALNPSQANSMADKIASSKGYPLKPKGKTKSLGFIPNFSPIDRALNTEEKMGGRGVLDFKPGLGLYVRDGKTQPNFAAVMRDHPEGIGNAVQNSKKMQSSMSAGFIPNFAGIDPMSLFFMMQSMGGAGGGSEQMESKLERGKLAQILRDRRASQQLLKQEENKELKDQAQINYIKNEQRQLLSQENKQRTAINNQLGVFAKDRGGKTVGGIGGALGRFGSRAGTGLAFAAPLLADTASQFVGDDISSSGRAAKAGVSALGTTASYAAIGNLIAPGPGALVGAGVGVGLGIYEVIKQLNDIMPEVAQQIEQANTKFNKISSSAQTLSISLETLNSAQERTDLSTETRLRLRNKAEQDFAKSITELNQALPGAGDEIINLYKKIGDTAELREKINEFQIKAQRESKGLAAGGALLGTSEKIKSITDLNIFQKAATISGAISEEDFRKRNLNDLDESKKLQYDEQIRSGGNQLSDLFANFSKSGGPIGSADIQRIQEAYKSGGGVEGVKSLLDELTRTGSYSKLIGQELKKADALGLVGKYIETWKVHQQEIEVYQKALEEENQKITSGAAKITSLSSLQTQFGLPGGISEKALSNIDYKAIDEGLAGGKRKEFANQVASGITQLSNSLGFSADRLKYLSEYTQKTAEIQKEYNNGIITGTQAFERLKIAMDKIEFEQNKGNMFSGERASANQGIMERQLKQANFAEGLNPLVSFFDRFGDNAATTADKINKSFGNLAENMQTGFEDAFGAFIDGTKSADDAMRDMMLSISQQIMKEQFSIGMRSLIGGLTGGGGFGEQSGGGGGLLGGIFNSIFGNGKAKGGIIKKYSSGGPVAGGSGVRDDVPAVLTDGEYVLRKSAVNKYGTSMLDMLNRGGMVKGYAGGGGIEDRGIRGADRSASVFIKSLFSRGNDVSSYLNDRFLQANNRMVFRGGKGGDMLSKPVPFTASLPGGIPVSGKALHATPYFQQAAGYANNSLNIPFKNVAGKPFTVSGSTGNLPLASRANMVQSFYGLEDALVTRGSVYAQAIGEEVSGIKVKDFLNARVSDRVLDNLSLNEKALVSMTEKDGLELNPMGGRKGQAFLTKGSSGRYIEAINMPGFLRKQIDKEIKYAKISSPDYMSKAQRGAYFDSLSRAKSARGLGAASTFFEDLNLASKFNNIGKFGGSLLKTGGRMFGMAGGAFGNLDLFDQAMGELGFFPGGGSNSMSRGGRIKGYASGGSVSSMLNNSYDFFGAKGEKLTQNYTSEAFNTTVNSPEELANIPALTGKFNISDMLSSRAIIDENNPMNALRDQRFLGMQSYQQQVSNFKTGYNEQYRQVEEARKEAQRQADEINQQRRDQYNKQRSNMIIGGLFSAATSIGGGLLNQFGGGGGLGGLLGGGGGGGGGLGSIFSQIFSTGSGLLQTALTGGFSSGYSGGQPTISQYQKAQEARQQQQVSDSIRAGQFSGYGDPFSVQQNRLFPQFGSQSGFGGSGGGFGGNNFGPTSSVGGFQFGVGLGAPAGVQTQFQNSQRDYLMNFASPVAPTAPGRGNLVYDFLNQNSNPFGYNRGYAKGGLVRGYQVGGELNPYLPASALNLKVKGSDGKTYTLAQMGLTTNNTYADLQKMAGQGFGGGYNSPEIINTMSGIQNALGSNFSRVTGVNDLYHMTRRAEGKSHRSGNKSDFTVQDYKTGRQQTIDYLKSIGLSPKDYSLTFEGKNTPGSTGPHFDFELKKSGIAKVAAMNMSMPAGNIAGTNTPAVMGGVGLPSKSSIPDINRNQSTFSKEAGKGILAGGVGAYGLKKIIDSKLGQEGLMSTLRSAYGGAFKSSLLPSRNYGSNFVKPATAIDKMFLPLNTPPTIMPKQLIAPNEMADILKYAKSPAMGPAGKFAKVMPKELVAGSEAANILKYAQSGALKPSLLSRSLSGLKGFGTGILKGAAFAPATEFLTPPSLGPTKGTIPYEIEMGYRNLSGQLTPLGERVLGTDNASAQVPLFRNKQGEIPGDRSTYTPERIAEAFGQQTASQQYPWEDIAFQLQTYLDETSSKSSNLYKSVGSLYDMKNKGDYGRLASKFSSFYGNNLQNRYTPFGEKGFNNYLKYIGADPYSTMSSLNSFKSPMTPNTYSPFAFGSQNFGGFGGSGYQSGFSSTGNAFSNYFSTGSRLGITPSWASKAAGGMIYGGTSTKDDVPAMLMGGEYVIRKDVVDRMGEPFFNSLNRGKPQGFAEGGPVGTGLPSVVGGGSNQQDNSRGQFVDSITKLVKSLEQLNKGIEEQNKDSKAKTNGESESSDSSSSGVINNISINVNVDQNGKTTDSKKEEDQSGGGSKEETDQEQFKKTMEKSRVLAELLRQQVLKTIVEEQRPGGVLYGGSKGRDMGR